MVPSLAIIVRKSAQLSQTWTTTCRLLDRIGPGLKMRLLSARHVCQEWVAVCLLVQVVLTCGLLWLFSRSPELIGYARVEARPRPCVDKSVRYNLHLSEEKASGEGGKRVIDQAIETHDVLSFLDRASGEDAKAAAAAAASSTAVAVDRKIDEVLDTSRGLLDRSRMFKTHMHQIVGSDWADLNSNRKVCLGAQTSLDRLYSLGEMVGTWAGPISISVFVSDVEYVAAKVYIDAMRHCFPGVGKRVSFHFTHPVMRPAKYSLEMEGLLKGYLQEKMDNVGGNEACKLLTDKETAADMIKLAVKKTYSEAVGKKFTNWRTSMNYPQNLLRNLAKSGCQTEYTMIPDIDMIPSPKMDLMLEEFLTSQRQPKQCNSDHTCAYVVPVYEISYDVSHLPTTKKELLALLKAGNARGFHSKLFSLNSKSTNLPKWEALPETKSLNAAYNVTSAYKFRYEPVYVARADTPPFDERFIGFGMTRNTQVYEMYVAGYQFHVLDNVFASHWGFQTIQTRPQWRAKQQEANNKRFDDFAKEVTARYGRDPYNMIKDLKKLNLQHIKVAYGGGNKSPKSTTV